MKRPADGPSAVVEVHADLTPFRQLNLVTDALCLLAALEVPRVAALVGHDFGSVVAAWAALIWPDVFQSVLLMSAPFAGPAALSANAASAAAFDQGLATLDPPRRHYTHFFGLPQANADLSDAPQGLAAFLRAYFHVKSGDFAGNAPVALGAASPEAFARLPGYYVMPREKGMAETVAADMPTPAQIAACQWLPPADLDIYAAEFGRTGFQGARRLRGDVGPSLPPLPGLRTGPARGALGPAGGARGGDDRDPGLPGTRGAGLAAFRPPASPGRSAAERRWREARSTRRLARA